MAEFDDVRKKRLIGDEDEEGGRGSHTGSGGQGGSTEFHDFLLSGTTALSAIEKTQKLAEHREKNGDSIDKQKKRFDELQEAKENKAEKYQHGMQVKSDCDEHPILSKAAEFDGRDRQTTFDPTRNEAKTNDEMKKELTYQHQKRFENERKFIPPRPTMG